jgi:copper(I)-binding protein
MFMGLSRALKAGDAVPVTLTFASGAKVKATFVVGMGPPVEAHHHH